LERSNGLLFSRSRSSNFQVEVFDVEGEDLGGAGGGLVQHPVERLVAQQEVAPL
jgi:hypothetical protein